VYLNCHSWFSFKYGTLSPEELLQEAQRQGIVCLALTDINNTSGIPDFVRLASQYGVRPVAGIDFRRGVRQHFVGLARNIEGFRELNDFLSFHLHEKSPLPERAPLFKNAFVVYPFRTAPAVLRDNEFTGLAPGELLAWRRSPHGRDPARRPVMLHPVTFRDRTGYNLHRLLRAIGRNTLLRRLAPDELAPPEAVMLHKYELIRAYGDCPEVIDNTLRLLDACSIDLAFGTNKNKKTFSGNLYEDELLLTRLCHDNLRYRYPDAGPAIAERFEKEIRVITDQGYAAYFLINWDIVRYAQHRNYFYVGRGSGANSMVAYLLRITDVDPVDLDLYFERFINAYRTSPPDFDLDFSWKDRDDIIGYLFRKHGRPHVAQLATYSTFQADATTRELGKVFGLPKREIDALETNRRLPPAHRTDTRDRITRAIAEYGRRLIDFPNHLSVHAGGILIAERPLHYYSATEIPPKGFPITQFSMLEAEDLGLYKFDILSQRGLGHIKDAVELVLGNRGTAIDIHDVKRFKEDPAVKDRLRNARCTGCFYIESPAMRGLLKKLQVETYLGLVAASSIIRPGVASSGMMREYILRFRGMPPTYETPPAIYDILRDNYGVMVYQEDVIKVAHQFAGLSLGEADMLRRGMSGKYRGRAEFKKVEEAFFANCRTRGYPEAVTREVWRQIESFAGYAFSKGHSASYAVESYQSLFLKTHYPLEHMVAVINNFGGFYRTEFYVHEARMLGAAIHAPDINRSEGLTTIHGNDLFLGLGLVAELEKAVVEQVLAERGSHGPFASLEDFMKRVAVSVDALRILVRTGAFRFTGRTKKQLLWDIHAVLGAERKTRTATELFEPERRTFALPDLVHGPLDDAWDELELLGFPLCSPFALLRDGAVLADHPLRARDLEAHTGRDMAIAGYLVTTKPTRTKHGEAMAFGTFLDADGAFFDTTHFPRVAAQYPFRGRGCYLVHGRVDEEFGFCSIVVNKMEKIDLKDRDTTEQH